MERIEVEVGSEVRRSFRVEQVAGMMDVALPGEGEKTSKRFAVDWPGLGRAWKVGALVGGSGSGKGTVARAMMGWDFLEVRWDRVSPFEWPGDRPVLDGFAPGILGKEIGAMFQSVGFSDAPAWLVPWPRLSTGQRWRADLARALMVEREVVGLDEFGALVGEDEAKVGAIAVTNAVRKGRAGCKRVVLVGAKGVGAGGDLGEGWLRWAEPDWWVDMDSRTLHLGLGLGGEGVAGVEAGGFCGGRRPGIEFEVRRCDARQRWPLYRASHYLSGKLNAQAVGYEGWVRMGEGSRWRPAGFVAVVGMMGMKGIRSVHRLVVLPAYQGLGLAGRLLGMVAAVEGKRKGVERVVIRTSHPGLVRLLERDVGWQLNGVQDGRECQRGAGMRGSFGRASAVFAWGGQ